MPDFKPDIKTDDEGKAWYRWKGKIPWPDPLPGFRVVSYHGEQQPDGSVVVNVLYGEQERRYTESRTSAP